MFIKEIKRDYNDFGEATVVVSDGKYEITCCAFEFKENQDFKLSTFLAENIMLSECHDAMVEKKEGFYEYKLVGQITNKNKQIINIGKIIIELDGHIPNDLRDGDFVELECLRVDLL